MIVEFRTSSAKVLKEIKDKGLLKRVVEFIEAIEKAESLVEIANLKKLKGDGNYFRLRIEDYRIGIALDKGIVVFVRCLNRKDIYKYFP